MLGVPIEKAEIFIVPRIGKYRVGGTQLTLRRTAFTLSRAFRQVSISFRSDSMG